MTKREFTLNINDDSVEGIPGDVWARFKNRAKAHFPDRGDDAWASYIAEVIIAEAGGTDGHTAYFLTDVPIKNANALEEVLAQAGWSWDRFHAYLLQVATKQGALRIINFSRPEGQPGIEWGTFIATGIKPKAFNKIEAASSRDFETFMAAMFLAAAEGEIILTGDMPASEDLSTITNDIYDISGR